MAREHNFLLGQGERLASEVPIRKAGGTKELPYDLSTAKSRIAQCLARVEAQIANLPDDACPRGEAPASSCARRRRVTPPAGAPVAGATRGECRS